MIYNRSIVGLITNSSTTVYSRIHEDSLEVLLGAMAANADHITVTNEDYIVYEINKTGGDPAIRDLVRSHTGRDGSYMNTIGFELMDYATAKIIYEIITDIEIEPLLNAYGEEYDRPDETTTYVYVDGKYNPSISKAINGLFDAEAYYNG